MEGGPAQVLSRLHSTVFSAVDGQIDWTAKLEWYDKELSQELGYNAEQVRELFRLIDWMMHLRDDLSERFRIDLDQLEEELGMSYVTSVERLAKAEGKVEGKAEGKREDLSSLLEAKFGPLTPDVVQRIRQTDSVEKLNTLLLQVLTIDSVEQLNW